MMDLGRRRRRYSPDGVNSAEDLGGGPGSRVIQWLDAYRVLNLESFSWLFCGSRDLPRPVRLPTLELTQSPLVHRTCYRLGMYLPGSTRGGLRDGHSDEPKTRL